MNPTVAIIDIGSNSIKLLVATRSETGELETLSQHVLESRISRGIGQDAVALSESGMRRGLESVRELLGLARLHHPDRLLVTATSAVRDASNGPNFAQRIETELGVKVRILCGDEEAHYIGRGVQQDPALRGQESFYLFDLGGGSLELLEFAQAKVRQQLSLPLGAVRSTERFFGGGHNRVGPAAIEGLKSFLRTALHESGFAFTPLQSLLVGTGGGVNYSRRLIGIEKKLPLEDIPRVLQRTDLERLFNHLARHTLLERSELRGLPPERADIMPAAVLTILCVMEQAGVNSLTHSTYNLRYGLAAELLTETLN